MALRPLNNKPEPVRGLDVPVIKEFPNPAKSHRSRSCFRPESNREVEYGARKQTVSNDLEGVLIEGSQELESLRAVMDLMQPAPQKIGAMTPEVPPIINKCEHHVAGKRSRRRAPMIGRPRPMLHHPAVPTDAGEQYRQHLAAIYRNGSHEPAFDYRKTSAGE